MSSNSTMLAVMLRASLLLTATMMWACEPHVPTGEATAEPAAVAPGEQVSAPFDVGAVVREVHFAYRQDGAGFSVADRAYRVRVSSDSSSTLTPCYRSAGSTQSGAKTGSVIEGAPFTFQTMAIQQGGRPPAAALGTPYLAQNGDLLIERGAAQERLRNTDDGVEQSWSFARAPGDGGELVLHIQVAGQDYAGDTDKGVHFADPNTGLGVRYGLATWIDRDGKRTEVRPSYANGEVLLAVPRAVLESSTYPAVLDPTIGPEFGLDNPVLGGAAGNSSSPKVATDGINYMVVWENNHDNEDGGSDIIGTRVTKTGTVLDPKGIPISIAPNSQFGSAVAFDGTNYLVVWTDLRNEGTTSWDVFGTRVSTTGAVLDPEGIPISTAPGEQDFPSLAFDGTNYLVVWNDGRTAVTDNVHIYGTRVSKAGAVLDPAGIVVSAETSGEFQPSVAFDGTNYLVVWMDWRNMALTDSDIFAARVSKTGTVLDPAGIPISTAPGAQGSPSVAFDGTNYLVVWEDRRNYDTTGSDIYGARVTKTGHVLDADNIRISSDERIEEGAQVAFDGAHYLVVWQLRIARRQYNLVGARLNRAGVVLDPAGISISIADACQGPLSLVFNDTNYLVVGQCGRNPSQIYGTRVRRSGTLITPSGFVVSTQVVNTQAHPAVGFDGNNYLVVWHDDRGTLNDNIFGVRVNPAGRVLDADGIAITSGGIDRINPRLAFDGTNYLVVWQQLGELTASDIFGARVSTAGALLDAVPLAISTAANDQGNPTVVFGGGNYLVSWQDLRNGSDYDIFGARVSSAGEVLDASGIGIATATLDQLNPAMSFDGTRYFAVWQDYRLGSGTGDIFGARVSSAGTLLDPSGLAIAAFPNDQSSPAVVYDGTSFLVAWQDLRNGSDYDIFATGISPAGEVLDSEGIAVSTAGGDQSNPALAFNGSRYFLAVWEDQRSGLTTELYSTRLNKARTVLDPAGLGIAVGGTDVHAPALAGNGARFLITYQRLVPALDQIHIRAALMAL